MLDFDCVPMKSQIPTGDVSCRHPFRWLKIAGQPSSIGSIAHTRPDAGLSKMGLHLEVFRRSMQKWKHFVPGWWFGTFFNFPHIGNNHPKWLIFFRGVQTTNQVLKFTGLQELWKNMKHGSVIRHGWEIPELNINCWFYFQQAMLDGLILGRQLQIR